MVKVRGLLQFVALGGRKSGTVPIFRFFSPVEKGTVPFSVDRDFRHGLLGGGTLARTDGSRGVMIAGKYRGDHHASVHRAGCVQSGAAGTKGSCVVAGRVI